MEKVIDKRTVISHPISVFLEMSWIFVPRLIADVYLREDPQLSLNFHLYFCLGWQKQGHIVPWNYSSKVGLTDLIKEKLREWWKKRK